VSEEFRRNVVSSDSGFGYKEQTSIGPVPSGHLSALRKPENVLLAKLALLFGYVPVSSEKSGPPSFPSCTW
jgi:hypothetical protein